jgi:hypothetical protein
MWIVTILIMLAGGSLAASNLLIAKKPNARELIDKLIPFKGIVGILLLVWGVVDLVSLVRVGSALASFYGVLFLLVVVTELGLGFLLGYDLLSKHVFSRNAAAQAKGEQLRTKIMAYQTPLGMAAIGLAVFFFAMTLTYR